MKWRGITVGVVLGAYEACAKSLAGKQTNDGDLICDDCPMPPVRVWINQDGAFGLTDPVTYITEVLNKLNSSIDDFDFGVSLFNDRFEPWCYLSVVDMGGKAAFDEKVSTTAAALSVHSSLGSRGWPGDALSALPFVAKHQFDESEDTLNVFVVITEDWGKYHGMDCPYHGTHHDTHYDTHRDTQHDTHHVTLKHNGIHKDLGTRKGTECPFCSRWSEDEQSVFNKNAQDAVTCDSGVWYPTVEQLVHAIRTYKVVPLVLAAESKVDWWVDLWANQARLRHNQFAVIPVDTDSVGDAVLAGIKTLTDATSRNLVTPTEEATTASQPLTRLLPTTADLLTDPLTTTDLLTDPPTTTDLLTHPLTAADLLTDPLATADILTDPMTTDLLTDPLTTTFLLTDPLTTT
ncbi:hypothetical protein GNI_177750, partial [Gregarina niphandrodes]